MRGVKPLSVVCLLGILLAGCAQPESVTYGYYTKIPTVDVAALAVTLGIGESFEGRLEIWKAHWRDPRIAGAAQGSLVFYVRDPYHRKILDAGHIEGVYEFAFTAETSGEYMLVFDDAHGHCVVVMHHNYSGTLEDVSVIR